MLRVLASSTLRARGARALSSAAAGQQYRSVKVSVGDVSLHAVVPADESALADKPRVLCLPSGFGAVKEDFREQFEALGDKYAFVGVDPRGYGESRPPTRDFPDQYFERDADDVLRAADALGLDQFALLGWSAGANTSAVFAGKYPDRVSRLVLVAGNAFVGEEDLEIFDKIEDVSRWSRSARARGEAIYGAEELQAGWSAMCSKLKSVYEEQAGDLYCEFLPRIKCKTLVVTGMKDKVVADYHGEYLSERIMHSRLHVFPEGRHDLVLAEAPTFNGVLDAFLMEPDDKLTQSREFVAVPSKPVSSSS